MTPSKRSLAFAVIAVLVITWVLMGELAAAFEGGTEPYDKPLMIAFLIHVVYTLCLPMLMLWRRVTCPLRKPASSALSNTTQDQQTDIGSFFGLVDKRARRRVLGFVTILSLFQLPGMYMYYASMPLSPVPVNIAIFNSCNVFIFVFSVIIGVESFSFRKSVALVVSIFGVFVCYLGGNQPVSSDSSDGGSNAIGYVFILLSTILYSLYSVLYKVWLPPSAFSSIDEQQEKSRCDEQQRTKTLPKKDNADTQSMAFLQKDDNFRQPLKKLMVECKVLPTINTDSLYQHDAKEESAADVETEEQSNWIETAQQSTLIIGLLGIIYCVLTWPVLLLADKIGFETLEWPSTGATIKMIALFALDSCFNAALLFGMTITTPLFINTGVLLSIPASIVADVILHQKMIGIETLGGVALICIGFMILSAQQRRESRINRLKEEEKAKESV